MSQDFWLGVAAGSVVCGTLIVLFLVLDTRFRKGDK
jgi:hypothetical protein